MTEANSRSVTTVMTPEVRAKGIWTGTDSLKTFCYSTVEPVMEEPPDHGPWQD